MISTETKLVLLSVLKKRVAEVEAEVKAEWCEGVIPGDRKTAVLGKEKLGSVTYTNGRVSHRVVEPSRFQEWVKEHHPDVLETRVPDWFEKNILAAGGFDPATGEEVPGIQEVEGAPYASVRPSKDAPEIIQGLVEQDTITWSDTLQIGGK